MSNTTIRFDVIIVGTYDIPKERLQDYYDTADLNEMCQIDRKNMLEGDLLGASLGDMLDLDNVGVTITAKEIPDGNNG